MSSNTWKDFLQVLKVFQLTIKSAVVMRSTLVSGAFSISLKKRPVFFIEILLIAQISVVVEQLHVHPQWTSAPVIGNNVQINYPHQTIPVQKQLTGSSHLQWNNIYLVREFLHGSCCVKIP